MKRESEKSPSLAGTAALRVLRGGDEEPVTRTHLPIGDEYGAAMATGEAEPVRAFLLGPDALARAGLRALLLPDSGTAVVGEGEPGPWALAAVHNLCPDVVVVHGVCDEAGIAELAWQVGEHVPLLTVGDRHPGLETASSLCARLPGSVRPAELSAAARLVAAGYRLERRGRTGPPGAAAGPSLETEGLAEAVAGAPSAVSAVDPRSLTGREHEVLALIAGGLSNAEIAGELTLSEYTVKSHVQNLLRKLRVRNRLHAVIYAFETGLRRLDPGTRP